MSRSRIKLLAPNAEDLAFEPELASLAIVDAALALAVQSLIARNPELLVADGVEPAPPIVAAARNIVVLYREVHAALDDYRALLPARDRDPADFPF